ISGLSPDRNFWMVTIVNKQDLWWNDRDSVKKHYANGKYSELIENLVHRLGTRKFQHEFLPVSLAVNNLSTSSGEIIKPTSAGYDQLTHLRYLEGLFGKIEKLTTSSLK
ncbi:MAG: hypothetical protein ACK4UN_10040, partial [Limisphaerales bacterium]